jgi:hypothetical protein
MGFYERWIVPRLLDPAMRNRLLDRYRQRTIETARGLVLEVGVGSGLNLPLYGPGGTRVVGLEPSPQLLRLSEPPRRFWPKSRRRQWCDVTRAGRRTTR